MRIIIECPETNLHYEAGYIFADCSRRVRFLLQCGGGPYMLHQLSLDLTARSSPQCDPASPEARPESEVENSDNFAVPNWESLNDFLRFAFSDCRKP